MSDVSNNLGVEDEVEDTEASQQPLDRSRDLSKTPSIRKKLLKLFADVERGFGDQNQRANDQMDYWDIYNCKLGPKQFYTGNSHIFVPIVHNAVEARVTRFVNQIFPQSGRYVECISEDGTLPQAIMALMEHYVRKGKLRTDVVPALIRNGDIEGQYNAYVDWNVLKRHVAMRVQRPIETEDQITVPGTEIDDIREETLEDGSPAIEVLSDTDVVVLPPTAETLDKALQAGGCGAIIRRWSEAKIRSLMKDGTINKTAGQSLLDSMTQSVEPTKTSKAQQATDAAGVRVNDAGIRYALIYEGWVVLPVKGEDRLCRAYYGGNSNILGCTLNPFWSDRCPLLSSPVRKVTGSFKGQSLVKFCADQQYAANDAANMGNDSAAYSLMPIVMTDPEKNPRIGSMVLALSAIWETSPTDTQFAEFPKLWTDALQIVAQAAAQIATTLSVSPAAITQQTSDKNLSQAEISNEQQVDILTTADAVTVLGDTMLTPSIIRFAEMDHQYRDDDITVRAYGDMGVRAAMEKIPPIQMENRYEFRWFGIEAAQNAQQMQQQIAAINVIRGIPPQAYPGYRLNLQPVMAQMIENTFGPRLAPLMFEDMKSQLSLGAQFENSLLVEGIDLPVHPMDNDAEHLQEHMPVLMQTGDPSGVIRVHMERHKLSMEQKMQAQMMQGTMPGVMGMQGAQGMPGVPGGAIGGQQQPGVAGTPRIGAQPGQVRNGQAPPGAIHHDQMHDPRRQPRPQ